MAYQNRQTFVGFLKEVKSFFLHPLLANDDSFTKVAQNSQIAPDEPLMSFPCVSDT